MKAPGYRDIELGLQGGVGFGRGSLSSVFIASAPVTDCIMSSPQIHRLKP